MKTIKWIDFNTGKVVRVSYYLTEKEFAMHYRITHRTKGI